MPIASKFSKFLCHIPFANAKLITPNSKGKRIYNLLSIGVSWYQCKVWLWEQWRCLSFSSDLGVAYAGNMPVCQGSPVQWSYWGELCTHTDAAAMPAGSANNTHFVSWHELEKIIWGTWMSCIIMINMSREKPFLTNSTGLDLHMLSERQ